MLDELVRSFDEATSSLARLLEELQCLDDGTISGLDFGDTICNVVAVQSLAADVQQRAADWKCKCLARPEENTRKCWAQPLAGFLDEAVVAGVPAVTPGDLDRLRLGHERRSEGLDPKSSEREGAEGGVHRRDPECSEGGR